VADALRSPFPERAADLYRLAAEAGAADVAAALLVLMGAGTTRSSRAGGSGWRRRRRGWNLASAAERLEEKQPAKAVPLYEDAVRAGHKPAQRQLNRLKSAVQDPGAS
jgi:TPR repeat protein